MSALLEGHFVVKGARLAFPNLWVAQEYEPGDGKPRYSATLLIPKNDPQLAAIDAIGLKLFKQQFKEKEGVILFNATKTDSKKTCFADGDTKVLDGYAGCMALTAHRAAKDGKPKVLARDAETPLLPADGKPYPGCYVNAKILFWAQDNKHGKALRATLEVIQFVRDGEAFSGAAAATTDGMEAEPEEQEAPLV